MTEPSSEPIEPDGAAPAAGEAEDARDAEARRRTGLKVLVVLGLTLALLMLIFGATTSRNYKQFEDYRRVTLEDPQSPPAWEREQLDVDGCVDAVLDWIEACPGVSSWCEGSLPDVTNLCLGSVDSRSYCEDAGEEIGSTRFGYQACAERYDEIEEHYARRAAKKHCALIYRVIAGHCRDELSGAR
ncbi:hypothetical protein G6O69_02615 [Pseudenhygromyxa sp. WMMC2535]|uniref:hypothetical protein n=1 Tax=Pseudenhygromyxa sp. WMMC2535 TaxID=2712867 RepID=UPI0015543AE6|nr:hypothetical protein [Pseudenhygromyxa sp. WMMC2535]NVB36708.1 hypothetical protein [Pseudenhygromyxa sp. WMMC2535]